MFLPELNCEESRVGGAPVRRAPPYSDHWTGFCVTGSFIWNYLFHSSRSTEFWEMIKVLASNEIIMT